WRAMGPGVPPAPMGVPPFALGLIGLGAVCLWRGPRGANGRLRPAWRHAMLWTLLGAALSLPPRVLMGGHEIALPQLWLYEHLPAIRVLRINARLGVVGLVGLCLLAGLAFATIMQVAGPARLHGRSATMVWAVAAVPLAAALILQPRLGVGYPPG